MNSLSDFVVVSALLFGIGVYGLVTKRNAMRLLFAVELMINAANLNFVAFNQYLPYQEASNAVGQTVVLFSIALAAAEAAVILAIVVVAYRLHNDIDVSEMKTLEG
ncbi:MAG: NADH-quinone oxidoreductase subunit NuoK [Nitrososphaerota archaeon]|nr:NADH-quinone oxidoreductase subunit NuoK [Nitrososphaerota archaeon]MDG6947599.1 NADH-quinone oxidoreductase subunit NuoK [Nitrososphaerota archaeon]MDG7012150.1 NADH-quinone oxidoreductase subunit NuoK [Nitrososphaerota archaeon]MDG7013897.1 NADH-quinone oxidoreductase subunit NuoK [Nitrososphaerota archaeon]MDG7025240.1 NADH-quinone oxidoreductase subunit NuoK [Nitrososphaerota archaeon]